MPAQVVERERLCPRELDVPPPPFRGPVRARFQQPVEHGEVDRALHRELKAAVAEEMSEHGCEAHLLPEPAEDQIRAELPHGASLQAPPDVPVNGCPFRATQGRP